ncbi:MAG: preprotein translocase subunit SecG [Candidatus Omnitrophica bacterium]|nr:preprotein translocase subunit SecG [Candidatus Omnitrophota bacterium]
MFFVHVIACVLIIAVILMQSGRGGGLTEGFASAESMFGAQTNEFMIKLTTALATVFLVTSLTLAVVSAKKEVSVMAKRNAQDLAEKTVKIIANTQK